MDKNGSWFRFFAKCGLRSSGGTIRLNSQDEVLRFARQSGIDQHVLDVQSMTAHAATARANQLRRAGGVAKEDAEADIRSTSWAAVHTLARKAPDSAFATIVDSARSRPAVIEEALRRFLPPAAKRKTATIAASGKEYGWSLDAISFDVEPPEAEGRLENVSYHEPMIDAPHVVAYLSGINVDRDKSLVWTNDESVVMHASSSLVRWVVFEEASVYTLLDLDVVVRDRLVGLSSQDRQAWQVAYQITRSYFLPKIPGLGPHRFNQNANLVETCSSAGLPEDDATFEASVRAALKGNDLPSLEPIFGLLTLSAITSAISFETGESDSLEALVALRTKRQAGQAKVDREFRQQQAGRDQNLLVLYRDRLNLPGSVAPRRPAGRNGPVAAVAGQSSQRSKIPPQSAPPPPVKTTSPPATTEDGDEDAPDEEMPAEDAVPYGPAQRLNGSYSAKKRPFNVEMRRTAVNLNGVKGGIRKAGRYNTKCANGATYEEPTRPTRVKRSRADRKANAAELFGTIVPDALRRACKTRGRRAAKDSDDSDDDVVSGLLSDDDNSEASNRSDNDDTSSDGEQSGDDTPMKTLSSFVSHSEAKTPSTAPDKNATKAGGEQTVQEQVKQPRKAPVAASRDSKPVKKQFGLMTIQTDYSEAYRRVAVLDMSTVDKETLEQLKAADSLSGTLDRSTGTIKIGETEAVALTLDKDLRLIDHVCQQQFGYEMRMVADVLRRSIAAALLLHPSHGFLEQAGLGFDPNDKGQNRFRRLVTSIYVMLQERWPAGSNAVATANWRIGRDGVGQRKTNTKVAVRARQLAGLPPAAEKKAAAQFDKEWAVLPSNEQELLAQLDLPLFVLDAANKAQEGNRTAFSSMPVSVYRPSFKQCFTAAVTSLFRNLPLELDRLGRRLLLDFMDSGPRFIDWIGNELGVVEPTAFLFENWSTATSEAWTSALTDSAVAKQIDERVRPFVTAGITGAPLVRSIPKEWHTNARFHIAIGLRSAFSGFNVVEESNNKFISDTIAEAIVEVLALVVGVIQAQYRGIAQRQAVSRGETWSASPEEADAKIHDWLSSSSGLIVDASGLVEASAAWRDCFDEPFPLTSHGTSLVISMDQQQRRIKHAPDALGALVENLNHLVRSLNGTVNGLPLDQIESLRGKIRSATEKPTARSAWKRSDDMDGGTRSAKLTPVTNRSSRLQVIDPKLPALALLDGVHDSPAIEVINAEGGTNLFPLVKANPSAVIKIKTCSERILAHFAPSSLPCARPSDTLSTWDDLAPILLPVFYQNASADALFMHGQFNYLPDCISKLMLDPSRVRGGSSEHAGHDMIEMVEKALRPTNAARKGKGLTGWVSAKAANAFEKQVCAFEYIEKGDEATMLRIKSPISFGRAAQHGRWNARRDLQPSPPPRKTLVRLAEPAKRSKYDYLSEANQVMIRKLADGYETADGLFVGIDPGEKVKAAISLTPRKPEEAATSFLLHDRAFRMRDDEDRAATERAEAASPLAILRTALQQHLDGMKRTNTGTLAELEQLEQLLSLLASLDRANPSASRQRRIQRNQRKAGEMQAADFMVAETVKVATLNHQPKTAPSLVVVADGSGTLGGRHSGASGVDRRNKPAKLYIKRLRERRDVHVLVIKVDEFRTSQTCCSFECQEYVELSKNVNKLPIKTIYPRRVSDGGEVWRLLNCINDGKVYHRDVSASFLMVAVLVFKVYSHDGEHIFSNRVEAILGLPPRNKKLPKKWALTAPPLGTVKTAKLAASAPMAAKAPAKASAAQSVKARAAPRTNGQATSSTAATITKNAIKARGIENLQNDCFIASVVQALFWAFPRGDANGAGEDRVELELEGVFLELEDTSASSNSDVDDLRTAIFNAGIYGNEHPGSQQDAASWLAYLISVSPRFESAFQLQLEEVVTCTACGVERRQASSTTTLAPSLNALDEQPIAALLSGEFEDEREQKCSSCAQQSTHSVRKEIKSTSDFLLVQPRLGPLSDASEKSCLVLVKDSTLNLSAYSTMPMPDYELLTVVTHRRSEMTATQVPKSTTAQAPKSPHSNDKGHYVAYATSKSRLGQTTRFNDEIITAESWNDFPEERPTILIYKKVAKDNPVDPATDDVQHRRLLLSADLLDRSTAERLIAGLVNQSDAPTVLRVSYDLSWKDDLFDAAAFFNNAEFLRDVCAEQRKLSKEEIKKLTSGGRASAEPDEDDVSMDEDE